MTTVSRLNQVSHSSVASSGDWDHRLNRLLEDLQDTVIPSEAKLGNANEYREFRMTQRTQVNDEPAQQVDEKWVEIGTRGGGGLSITPSELPAGRSVAFSDQNSRSSSSNVQYLAPANSTTVLRSGPSSPTGYDTSPKVERKEFYTKASYTTLLKGGSDELVPLREGGDRVFDDFISKDFKDTTRSSRRMERIESSSSSTAIGQPLHASTPYNDRDRSARDLRTRSVTPPPKPAEALKTPPMVRKILQSSAQGSSHHHHHHHSSSSSYEKKSTTTTSTNMSGRPPAGGVPLPMPIQRETSGPGVGSYDDLPDRPVAKYYTSTTTTEHHRSSERDGSPLRRFPAPNTRGAADSEPPKKLDELLATFGDHSYSESSTRYSSRDDSAGIHRSMPYGPGTQGVQSLRSVRIDDNVQRRHIDDDDLHSLSQESELVQRRKAADSEASRNVTGPPVYFPPGQMFEKTEHESVMTSNKGGKMKAKREYKEKEKMKSKHTEKDGGGAVPVPVCLPVCCAAPCTIV